MDTIILKTSLHLYTRTLLQGKYLILKGVIRNIVNLGDGVSKTRQHQLQGANFSQQGSQIVFFCDVITLEVFL